MTCAEDKIPHITPNVKYGYQMNHAHLFLILIRLAGITFGRCSFPMTQVCYRDKIVLSQKQLTGAHTMAYDKEGTLRYLDELQGSEASDRRSGQSHFLYQGLMTNTGRTDPPGIFLVRRHKKSGAACSLLRVFNSPAERACSFLQALPERRRWNFSIDQTVNAAGKHLLS